MLNKLKLHLGPYNSNNSSNLMYMLLLTANILTMHSLSQLSPLKPPAQLHVQAPVSRVPPFRQVWLQAGEQQKMEGL